MMTREENLKFISDQVKKLNHSDNVCLVQLMLDTGIDLYEFKNKGDGMEIGTDLLSDNLIEQLKDFIICRIKTRL